MRILPVQVLGVKGVLLRPLPQNEPVMKIFITSLLGEPAPEERFIRLALHEPPAGPTTAVASTTGATGANARLERGGEEDDLNFPSSYDPSPCDVSGRKMGLSFRSPRFDGSVNHDRGTETDLPHRSSIEIVSKCGRDHTRLQHSSSKAVYRGLVGERDNRRNQGPPPLVSFPASSQ